MPFLSTQNETRAVGALLITAVGVFVCWLVRRQNFGWDNIGPAANSFVADAGLWVSWLTSPTALLLVSLVGTFFAVKTHHIQAWIHITVSLAVAVVISFLLKEIIQISRPADNLRELTSYGFPSTHATAAGTLWIVAGFYLKRFGLARPLIITVIGGTATAVISASRLVLGVHTVTDVTAGLMLGIGMGIFSLSTWSQLKRFWL